MFSLKVMGKKIPYSWYNHINLKNHRSWSKQLSVTELVIVKGWLFLHYCVLQVTGECTTVQSVIWFSWEHYLHIQGDSHAPCYAHTAPMPGGLGLLWADEATFSSFAPPCLLTTAPVPQGRQGSPHHFHPKHETEVGVSTMLLGG